VGKRCKWRRSRSYPSKARAALNGGDDDRSSWVAKICANEMPQTERRISQGVNTNLVNSTTVRMGDISQFGRRQSKVVQQTNEDLTKEETNGRARYRNHSRSCRPVSINRSRRQRRKEVNFQASWTRKTECSAIVLLPIIYHSASA
jgi:hypothetical protein